MINLVNNAVSRYGTGPVVAGAFFVGLISIPLLEKISNLSLRILGAVHEWVTDQTLAIRMRSMGCEVCALNHRSHIEGAHTP